jgi:hypothetical protein
LPRSCGALHVPRPPDVGIDRLDLRSTSDALGGSARRRPRRAERRSPSTSTRTAMRWARMIIKDGGDALARLAPLEVTMRVPSRSCTHWRPPGRDGAQRSAGIDAAVTGSWCRSGVDGATRSAASHDCEFMQGHESVNMSLPPTRRLGAGGVESSREVVFMPRVADVLAEDLDRVNYPPRDADFRVTCRVCGYRQYLSQAKRRDADESHSAYWCRKGCGVMLTVVPAGERPADWGYLAGAMAVIGTDERHCCVGRIQGAVRPLR